MGVWSINPRQEHEVNMALGRARNMVGQWQGQQEFHQHFGWQRTGGNGAATLPECFSLWYPLLLFYGYVS